MRKLLFVGAHIDDEQCAAGTLAKLGDEYEIFVLALSKCEESTVQIGYAPWVLVEEFKNSMEVLRISNYSIGEFAVRHLPEHRQEVLDVLISYRKWLNPDMVITSSIQDRHQDHRTVACEARRAFPYVTLLGFETPKNPLTTNHRCYVELDPEHLLQKEHCVECYKSQKVRDGMNVSIARATAQFRGAQIGRDYAEAFEVSMLRL